MNVLIGSTVMRLHEFVPELSVQFPKLQFEVCLDHNSLIEHISNADIYLGWLNREAFLAAKNLKWVQSPSSGTNHYLTIPELVESDVLLTSASGTHGACLAESTMGMIFAFTRGIRTCIQNQSTKRWDANRHVRSELKELTGSTMGIVGFGATGRALAKRAFAFDMRIVAVDLYPKEKPEYIDHLWGLDRLGDLLQTSDYVVVMVPYTEQTQGMIGAEQLAKMKPTAMLVIMSRGGIVDQSALVEALKSNKLAAAASDVFSPEPLPPDNELWEIENMLITSHVAGGTQLEGQYAIQIFTENLSRFLNGDHGLKNLVHKKRGF